MSRLGSIGSLLTMRRGASVLGAIDPGSAGSPGSTTDLGAEILVEFRTLTLLLTPGLLVYLLAVVAIAFAARRGIGLAVKLVWRFGTDSRRRLARVQGALDLGIVVLAIVLALRPLFVAVPLVLSLLVLVVGLVAAIALPEWIQSFVAGLSLTMRAQLREGDQVEVGDVAGVVDRVGLLRTRIRPADGGRISVPNRDILRLAVRVGGQQSAIPIEIEVGTPALRSTAARQRVQRVAHLSPFRRAGTTPRLEERDGTLVLTLQTWSTANPAVARDSLDNAISACVEHDETAPAVDAGADETSGQS